MTRQAMGFVVVGFVAGATNVLARILLSQAFSYEVAVVLAFPIALSIAYLMNRNFVFTGSTGSSSAEYGRFALVNIAALTQVWLISVALTQIGLPAIGLRWHAETIAHIIGVASPIATSFLAYKYFVFRDLDVAPNE